MFEIFFYSAHHTFGPLGPGAGRGHTRSDDDATESFIHAVLVAKSPWVYVASDRSDCSPAHRIFRDTDNEQRGWNFSNAKIQGTF